MHLGPYCLEVFVRYTVENYDCQSYAKTTGTNNHHMYAQFYVIRLSCLVHGKKEPRLCIISPLTLSSFLVLCQGMGYNYII